MEDILTPKDALNVMAYLEEKMRYCSNVGREIRIAENKIKNIKLDIVKMDLSTTYAIKKKKAKQNQIGYYMALIFEANLFLLNNNGLMYKWHEARNRYFQLL